VRTHKKTATNIIPPSTKPNKASRRKRRNRDLFQARPEHDHTTVMLTLDEHQQALVEQMAKALDQLRQHLLDFRDSMHCKEGRFPSLAQLAGEARKWHKQQHVLPQGAVEATAQLVLTRCIAAAKDEADPDWDQDIGSVFFSGGGAKNYIRVKDRRLWLPKLGWCPYHSKTGKGVLLSAVLEARDQTSATRIKGATLKNSFGDYRAVLSFQRANDTTINRSIAFHSPKSKLHDLVQRQGLEWDAAYQELADDIEPLRAADQAAEDAKPWDRDLIYAVFETFKEPSDHYAKAVTVGTIKQALKQNYKAARQVLETYGCQDGTVRIDGRVRRGYRLGDILAALRACDTEPKQPDKWHAYAERAARPRWAQEAREIQAKETQRQEDEKRLKAALARPGQNWLQWQEEQQQQRLVRKYGNPYGPED
jgi:hypothetical protein